jgi:HAD superfamily hydrolase (TIGR01509 family)
VGAITTIIFDLADVLVPGLGGLDDFLAQRTGVAKERCTEFLFGQWLVNLCCGEMSEDQYLSRVLTALGPAGAKVTPDALKEAIRANFAQPIAGMDLLVKQLQQRYQVVMLSDHAKEWVEYIFDTYPYMASFARKFLSYETGMTKRQGTAFAPLLTTLHRPAAACLLIDDNEGNIVKAAKFGINGIVFQNVHQVVKDLGKHGIKVNIPELARVPVVSY